jgi:hypothetical protein
LFVLSWKETDMACVGPDASALESFHFAKGFLQVGKGKGSHSK